MIVLGIETSCDDTSLALFEPGRGVLGNYTANQLIHDTYGGVVPELASRAHVRNLLPVYLGLLERVGVSADAIEGVGVSNGPGLVGSLLVGVGFAKALAFALQRPAVGVHHIEAHILSNELGGTALHTPALALVVSGGHTSLFHVSAPGRYKLVGNTLDDAAGECFDKVAKLLGLGFPGGPAIQKAAQSGDPTAIDFPRALMIRDNFDFSFSGLKTSVRTFVERLGVTPTTEQVCDIAASVEQAIVDVLVAKTTACARKHAIKHVYLAGGVAANARLRDQLQTACNKDAIAYHAPLIEYCTDNGAMVACTAAHLLSHGRDDTASLDVFARGPILNWN